MSIELTRPMKTAAAGIVAVAFLFVQQAAADNNGINRFAVRNCTTVNLLVCAYDATDDNFDIPYDANMIKPGAKRRSSCGSADRCKVITAISSKDVKKFLSKQDYEKWEGLAGGVGGFVGILGGFGVGFWAAEGTGVLVTSVAVGAAVGAGSAIAVVKTIEGVDDGNKCKQALRANKKAMDGIEDPKLRKRAQDELKQNIGGSWPKYRNFSLVVKDGLPVLVRGDKC